MKTLVLKWTERLATLDEDGNEIDHNYIEKVHSIPMSDILTCKSSWNGVEVVTVDGTMFETKDRCEMFFR